METLHFVVNPRQGENEFRGGGYVCNERATDLTWTDSFGVRKDRQQSCNSTGRLRKKEPSIFIQKGGAGRAAQKTQATRIRARIFGSVRTWGCHVLVARTTEDVRSSSFLSSSSFSSLWLCPARRGKRLFDWRLVTHLYDFDNMLHGIIITIITSVMFVNNYPHVK